MNSSQEKDNISYLFSQREKKKKKKKDGWFIVRNVYDDVVLVSLNKEKQLSRQMW
jgi:hypothetical protein